MGLIGMFLVIGLIGLGGVAMFLAGVMVVARLITKNIKWFMKNL